MAINIKPENRGKFTATKKRTGKTTEQLTHSKNPLTRKRAIFAQNARKWQHAGGGMLKKNCYKCGGTVNPMHSSKINQHFWGALIQQVAGTGDQIGQSVGGDAGDIISGTFKPEKGLAVLQRKDVPTWKKGVSFLAPGLGNMWAKKAQKKEQERIASEMEAKQYEQWAIQQPKSSAGLAGIVNPYNKTEMAYGGSLNRSQGKFTNQTDYALGGNIGDLETYDTGGLHEENPFGGIPIGMSADGNLNTVEEGESSFNFPDGKYIYSNRLTLDDPSVFGLPTSVQGKSYSDAAKKIDSLFKNRSSKVDSDTKKAFMLRLRESQEQIRQRMQAEQEAQTEMAYGGSVNEYQEGGNIPPMGPPTYKDYTTDLNLDLYGGLPIQSQGAPNIQMETNLPELYNVPTEPTEATFDMYKTRDRAIAKEKFNKALPKIGMGVSLLGQAAPLFSNIAALRGLKPAEQYVAPQMAANVQPQLVNRQQIQRNLARQLATNRQAIAERSSGNFGQYAANLQALNAGSATALANATLQANLADAQERARVEQLNLGISERNIARRMMADEINAQNMAAYEAQRAAYRQGIAQNVASVSETLFNFLRSKKAQPLMRTANLAQQV
jgi:hypothetical protein